MSENTALTTEVAGILSEAGEFESPRAPTVRAEEEPRQVTRVAAPRKDPLAVGDHVAESDLSPVAQYVRQSQNLPAIPPSFQNDWQMIQGEVNNRWQLGQELLAHATLLEKQGDYGQAALYQNRAAVIWAGANEARQTLANMKALADAHGIARFQQALVQRFPWLMHKDHYEACLTWAMGEYNLTREKAEFAPAEDIVEAVTAYEQHARASGRRLTAQAPKSKAKPSRNNPEGLSVGEKTELIAEMLRSVK